MRAVQRAPLTKRLLVGTWLTTWHVPPAGAPCPFRHGTAPACPAEGAGIVPRSPTKASRRATCSCTNCKWLEGRPAVTVNCFHRRTPCQDTTSRMVAAKAKAVGTALAIIPCRLTSASDQEVCHDKCHRTPRTIRPDQHADRGQPTPLPPEQPWRSGGRRPARDGVRVAPDTLGTCDHDGARRLQGCQAGLTGTEQNPSPRCNARRFYMVVGRLAVVLTAAFLAGSLFGAEVETPPMPSPAAVDARGTPPEASAEVGPVAPVAPPPSSAVMPHVSGTPSEASGQGVAVRRHLFRGRLRARLRAIFHDGD
jgi:hypothetical protein